MREPVTEWFLSEQPANGPLNVVEYKVRHGHRDHVRRESVTAAAAAICPRSESRYCIQSSISWRRRSNRSDRA